MDEPLAHAAGHLLGRSGTADVIDAVVAVVATRSRETVVLTGDRRDIERLLQACGARVAVVDV